MAFEAGPAKLLPAKHLVLSAESKLVCIRAMLAPSGRVALCKLRTCLPALPWT